jgi:hypothetical protein
MGNALHMARRGILEAKQSIRLSDTFTTVQQKRGDRLLKLFIYTFSLSIAVVLIYRLRIFTITFYNTKSRPIIWNTERKLMIIYREDSRLNDTCLYISQII